MTEIRNLERLLAEHLMGWTFVHKSEVGDGWFGVPPHGLPPYLPSVPIAWFASSGDGMLQVVEAIIRDDWEVSAEYSAYWQGQADTGWKAVLRCIRGQRQVVPAYAPTAPEAVARAALAALGVEVEG